MSCPKTCKDAANIEITQELLDRASLPWNEAIQFTQRLGEKRVVDGKDVAVVFIQNMHMDHATPHLMCACDFHYEVKEHAHYHYIDSHSCKRKKEWYEFRLNQVTYEYNDKGLSPKEIILDVFDRVVNKGEFLGQIEGDWFYVQNLGDMFAKLFWWSECDEKWPFRQGLPFYEAQLAQQHKLYAAVNALPPKLTTGDLAFSFALELVRELYQEKKLGLMGMVLVPYVEPPPKILDETRTPMLAWEEKVNPMSSMPPMLVWMTCLTKRFHAEVQRIDRSTATLCLFYHGRKGKPDRLVNTWKVGLSYGAEFGPDVSDVYAWQEMLKKFMYYGHTKQRVPLLEGPPKK